LRIAKECQAVREDAPESESGPSRIRTCNQGIMSLRDDSASPDYITACDGGNSTPISRADSKNELNAEQQRVLDAWHSLPTALRAGILAMIDAARKDG
jgi:hypothetical protein